MGNYNTFGGSQHAPQWGGSSYGSGKGGFGQQNFQQPQWMQGLQQFLGGGYGGGFGGGYYSPYQNYSWQRTQVNNVPGLQTNPGQNTFNPGFGVNPGDQADTAQRSFTPGFGVNQSNQIDTQQTGPAQAYYGPRQMFGGM